MLVLYSARIANQLFTQSEQDNKAGPSVYFSTQTDEDINITISDVKMEKVSPQRGLLMFRFCVDAPRNREGIYIEVDYIVAGIKREFSNNFKATLGLACDDITLYTFPDDKFPIEFHISSVVLLNDETISGTWNFIVNQEEIQKYQALRLFDLGVRPDTQYNIELVASNLRKVVLPEKWNIELSALRIDLCLLSPLDIEWQVWDASLELTEGEKIRPFSYLDPVSIGESVPENCRIVTFEVPEVQTYTHAQLTIFGLFFPPDISTEEKCNEYLYKLQDVIDQKYEGLKLKCKQFRSENITWGIDYVHKPMWMSDLDARLLIGSQELSTIKGEWKFELELNP